MCTGLLLPVWVWTQIILSSPRSWPTGSCLLAWPSLIPSLIAMPGKPWLIFPDPVQGRSSQIRSPCEHPQLKLTTARSVPHHMLYFCHPWLFQYFIPSTRLQAPKSRTISYIFYPSKPSTDFGTWIPTKIYWIREMQVAKCKVGHKNSIQIKCHSGSDGRKSKSSWEHLTYSLKVRG